MTDTVCEVWFYHLERASLEQVLPELLEKTLARGWKAIVRTSATERIEHLDEWLWAYREDSFLPHGAGGDAISSRQPVLLTTGEENTNSAQALFVIDDAPPGDISQFERCILIFDGKDDLALTAARRHWAAFKASGLPVAYWKQGERTGWERQG
jgi:DNA polymerase III subunit chi